MLIYQMVFGIDQGQVQCVFHDDTRASAGIGPNGEYNCFACGAKAHDEIGFIAKYFQVSLAKAEKIKRSFMFLQNYKYQQAPVDTEQMNFLKSQGISDDVIKKYFFKSGVGKLMFKHTWNGFPTGYTWFNSPLLSNHNLSTPKYKYDKNNIGGFLTPMDDVLRYHSLLICEGEKDMLTAKSMGIPNAVAKIGGTNSLVIGGKPVENKTITLCYDCDDAGRQGAIKDADILMNKFACKVKIIDLGLQDKEDLNDYFIKYGHTLQDFIDLVKATPLHVPTPIEKKTRVQQIVDTLTDNERDELKKIIGG
jgi:DNA primase